MLEIRVIGVPSVRFNNSRPEMDTRKALGLLYVLAVSNRPIGRDEMMTLLWSDYPDDKARSSLRRTLTTLRKALGDEWLHLENEALYFSANDGLSVDIWHLREAVAAFEDPAMQTAATAASLAIT